MNTIHVYGDSHVRFLFATKARWYWQRMGYPPDALAIVGKPISAASVAGLRPGASSTLQTKEIILKNIPNISRLCLGFGQVDLELGYYYRKVVKGEKDLKADQFPNWLAEIYENFILDIISKLDPARIAIKGCNLTVINNKAFAIKYIERIIHNAVEKSEKDTNTAMLRKVLLGEDKQNQMCLRFNDLLRQICDRHGLLYFDVNDAIATGTPPRVAPEHCPMEFDHHLADTMFVRHAHLKRLLDVFDLEIPVRPAELTLPPEVSSV